MDCGLAHLLHFVRRSHRLLEELLAEEARLWQISLSEIRILLFLDQTPYLDTARDVAYYCSMSKASVSGNVLKLATRGLLTADMDLADRRFQHLTMTEQAAPILSSLRRKLQQFQQNVLGTLPAQAQAQFLDLLTQTASLPQAPQAQQAPGHPKKEGTSP